MQCYTGIDNRFILLNLSSGRIKLGKHSETTVALPVKNDCVDFYTPKTRKTKMSYVYIVSSLSIHIIISGSSLCICKLMRDKQ